MFCLNDIDEHQLYCVRSMCEYCTDRMPQKARKEGDKCHETHTCRVSAWKIVGCFFTVLFF